MFSLRLVPLLCCLLLPLQGLAQAQPSGEAPLAPVTPPPLLPAPGAPEPEEAPDAPEDSEDQPEGEIIPSEERGSTRSGSSSARIPVQLLLGTVGGVVGFIPGAIMGLESLCFNESCSGDANRLYLGLGLALLGMTAGSSIAIHQVGYWLGGHGRFWPTVGGVVLGMLGGILVGVAVGSATDGTGLLLTFLGPPVGGVIAYELSHSGGRSLDTEWRPLEPRVSPLLTVSPRGGFIGGLVGRF